MSKINYTTPKGNLLFANIEGLGKETEPNSGKYKYQVVVKAHKDEKEVKEAMAFIDQFWLDNKPSTAKAKPKTKAYKFEEDKDSGEETGYVLFGMSTNTSFPSGDKKLVKVFTAKAPVREVKLNGKKIGAESIGRGIGSLAIYSYNGSFGTTMFLDAISLSKFVEYTGSVSADNVITDDDAEDIDLGETVVGTDAVEDEEAPRV